MLDMVKKGRHSPGRGERHASAKLNEGQVIAIRADKRPQRVIAEAYGINRSSVYAIKSGKKWKHCKRAAIEAAAGIG